MQLEHLLSTEQKIIRDTVRDFVNKEIMPIRRELENDYGLVEEIHQKLVDLGIQRMGYPSKYGGALGPGGRTISGLIREEIAKGDAGIALVSGINGGAILGPAIAADNKAVLDRFVPDFCGDKLNYACWAMTDATGGADTENPLLQGRGITTRARLDGNHYVINGTKSWPTNAGLASVYMVICTTDPSLGEDGIAALFVPADAEGLSFSGPEETMGFKTSRNGSIFFDEVRVPQEYRLAGPGKDAVLFHAMADCGSQYHAACIALGIAQAAYKIALDYTRERKSGGKAVRQWSMAAGILADMAIRIETSRAVVYNLAWMLDHPEDYPPPYSSTIIARANIARVHAADTGVWVTNKAAELMGSNGISPEYHLEKYLRDSKIIQLILGGQQISRYRIARGYYDYVA